MNYEILSLAMQCMRDAVAARCRNPHACPAGLRDALVNRMASPIS